MVGVGVGGIEKVGWWSFDLFFGMFSWGWMGWGERVGIGVGVGTHYGGRELRIHLFLKGIFGGFAPTSLFL